MGGADTAETDVAATSATRAAAKVERMEKNIVKLECGQQSRR